MRKYKLIEKMGLKVDRAETVHNRGTVYQGYSYRTIIDAHDLEAALEKATVITGNKNPNTNEMTWSDIKSHYDTHKGLLICVEELKREPYRAEGETEYSMDHDYCRINLPDRLKGKRIKWIIEELP